MDEVANKAVLAKQFDKRETLTLQTHDVYRMNVWCCPLM